MKIAFLIDKLSGGGTERVVSNLSQSLPNNVLQYIIIKRDDVTYPHKANIINIGEGGFLKTLFRIKRLKSSHNFDLVISLSTSFNAINVLSRCSDKALVMEHIYRSSIFFGVKKFIFKFIVKHLYNRADKVVCVSKVVEKDLIQNFGLNNNLSQVIYNFFEASYVSLKNENREPLKSEPFRIVTVGRLSDQKAHWHIFNIAKKLLKYNLPFVIDIYGDGENELAYKKLIDENNLNDVVNLCGFIPDVSHKYLSSDLFILTSKYEAFPMVIGEAMTYSVPILSADCKSGPREFLSEGDFNTEAVGVEYSDYGILVQAFDLNNDIYVSTQHNDKVATFFAEAIVELINNNQLREHYSYKSKMRANSFSKRKIMPYWLEVLDDCSGGN